MTQTPVPPVPPSPALTRTVLKACADLARFTETPGQITRTYLSEPTRDVHAYLTAWASRLGLRASVDAAGNLRVRREARTPDAPTLYLGSHLDTVPNAGAFDGVLGVVLGLALMEALGNATLPYAAEVVGFSEEEGVRFGVPYIGSRTLVGSAEPLLDLTDRSGVTVRGAMAAYGLSPDDLPAARASGNTLGYLELHIEQGPVLEAAGQRVGVVSAIAGQDRVTLDFWGQASHAGTTPMTQRHDALAAAAALVVETERLARATPGLVATVGVLEVHPGATNVVPGHVSCSLDVRHAENAQRGHALKHLLAAAQASAAERGVILNTHIRSQQDATPMDDRLKALLHRAAEDVGEAHAELVSGAGHDAVIVAQQMPVAMLFLRSPGGLSHHPDEAVLEEDVAAALRVGERFLHLLALEV
ncbi:allantoate amidohydrolase [Deinococcus ruber]|uniref:Zn-dependent hydrolase n=1 Tax=Deinococcus ruber TaxID=1848197 RepID=A0A918CMJ3_9DEIO|nr:allantoate amidohydrolase [Deinococcus ruber]GGR32032.1 Zn-dependent hydrolase [Deinococcus ruber]